VPLPNPDSLSLSEAATLVRERCDCSNGKAKEALRRAGLGGRLEAGGSIPLSAHPNPDVRARHSARRREALKPADWDNNIDWIAGTVGPYSSVLIVRASIEAWLGTEPPAAQVKPIESRRKGSSHKKDRAAQAIKDLWPQGVPDPKYLPNSELCRTVSNRIAEDDRQQGLRPINISDDTILRAAGRQR
jgi:hypothetical protein